MHVTVLTGLGAFDDVAVEWEALHGASRTATPFNGLTYAHLWWTHFGGSDEVLLVAVREGGELVGLAPLYRARAGKDEVTLRFVGGVEISDYLDVLCAPGREEDVVECLMAWLEEAECCLDLTNMPAASPVREAFLRHVPKRCIKISSEVVEVCPVVTLPDTWDGYLAQLEGKQRRELKRKLRKAGRDGLVSWHIVPPAAVRDAMPEFLRLHQASGAEKARFMTPEMAAFFTELAAHFAARGWLELLFLEVNGVPVATYFAFRFRQSVMLYNSGLDLARAKGLSAGWLLLAYHIEWCIHRGVRRYDFMRGREEYKVQFGGRPEPIFRLLIGRQCQLAVA